jgi:CubicO group peptidase (beta-lactamase class C family)
MRKRTSLAAALTCIGLALPLLGQPVREIVTGPLGQRIDRYLNKGQANGYSGSVLVAVKGEVVLSKGYGLADPQSRTPETAETVFSIGSITKQFTAAAILKLEMQGKLSVDDPITKFFPDVPEDKKAITLHQLLTHTAGFADALGDDYALIKRDDFLRLALSSALRSKPGETYAYSNVGYSLLGIVIELVSQRGYETYLYENILRPAGMERTGYVRPKFAKTDLAVGFAGAERWGTPLDHPWLPDGPGWHLRANGGLLSTVGDLNRWVRALRSDAVLSPAAVKKFLSAHVQEKPQETFYSYGWVVEKTERGTALIWHNGGNGVTNAFLGFEPKEGLVVVVSSNTSKKVSDVYARRIELMANGDVPELDEKAVGEWTGSYYLTSGASIGVRFDENDSLVATFDSRELIPWLFASGTEKKDETAGYDQRVKEIVAKSLAGDYAALAKAWGEPLASVAKRAPAFWGALEKNGGPVLEQEVFGTMSRGRVFFTVARLTFRKGKLFLTFIWSGPRLLQLRDSTTLERVLPARTTSEFAAPDTDKTATFEKDKLGRWTLVIKSATGELRAFKS